MNGDVAIRRLSTTSVLVVAAVAAAVSFLHIESLAVTHGENTAEAVMLPVSIDGTVAGASMAMLRAARMRLATPPLARVMLALSVTATLAANVVYGLPSGLIGAVISGWPAVAFIGSAELAILMARASAPAVPGRSPAVPAAPRKAAEAFTEFGDHVAVGQVPSIREIKARLSVGTDLARELQVYLAYLAEVPAEVSDDSSAA